MHEQLGIVGSGAIACGLAATAAARGSVVLIARSRDSADRASRRIDALLDKAGAGGAEVRVETDIEALRETTFAVEAVVEHHGTKAAVLEGIAAHLPAGEPLGKTTSSLSVGELAAASGRPEQFVGLHLFNPVHKMRLVELAFPDAAGPDMHARARRLCEDLDKTPVEVPDIPGFVVNRLLFPYLFSAVRLLDETDMDPDDIDRCMTLGAGHPMGPLALLDLVGLDVAVAIGEEIGAEIPARLHELVEDGALGRKTGRGLHPAASR